MEKRRDELLISVVSPLKNNRLILEMFVSNAVQHLKQHYSNYEIILIDDASEDDTHLKIEELLKVYECIRYIRLTKSFGEEVAVFAGLEQAIGDYTAIVFPETDPPSIIHETVQLCRKKQGIVFGCAKTIPKYSFPTRFFARLFHFYCKRYLKLELPSHATKYRVLSRQVVCAITQIRERFPFLRLYGSSVGLQSIPFPYEPLTLSLHNRSSKTLFTRIYEGFEIIISSSMHPLRLLSYVGLAFGTINLAVVFFHILSRTGISNPLVHSTMFEFQMSFMLLWVFIILAAIGKYLGRSIEESQDRPLYYILYEKNSNVMITNLDRRNITHGVMTL